jgi:integrase
VIGTNKNKSPPSRTRVLDDAELAAVWRAAGDNEFGSIVRLLILTGQRRSEVGGMAWPELKEDRTWAIPAERTKNGHEHVLPLPALTWSIIETVPRMVSRDWLFGRRAGGFTSWTLGKRVLDGRLDDEVKPWTMHDLRRSTATGMAKLGVQPHVIECVLNHWGGFRAGVSSVYNRNPYAAEMRQALDLWANHVATIVEGGESKVVNIRA